MKSGSTFTCLFLVVVAAATSCQADNPVCSLSSCRFTFCPSTPTPIYLGPPDLPLTTAICDGSGKVHVGVVTSGEALVTVPGGCANISKYTPPVLQGKIFSPSFWKTYSFPGGPQGTVYFSGVGHETPEPSQKEFFYGEQCFILPFTRYEILNAPFGDVVGVVTQTNPLEDCISFCAFYLPN